MSKEGRKTARKPATKFSHLRKKMNKRQIRTKRVKKT